MFTILTMIRAYKKSDRPEVIDLLRRNIPKYFDPSEERDLEKYLDDQMEDYFVYVEGFEILGAGGINYFPEEKVARISWDIVEPNAQGKGIGRKLTQYRINQLGENQNIETIIVRTSQHTFKFYEKMGFQLEKVEKDFWAKGFHLYQMTMRNH
ncbi:GNAT family N-acetyltransferase [Gelidibacter sp. F63206]|uniref:GNAT family N-acetyltransferase n=1 Tax=Gelidibacter sp. F63206 TaxID=2926425 RepID=UPI001FF42E77|nr:GNAT family N-acetyltransferase [Gelidibacter sp. F63206]MCK0114431.1 GNAT family N-acetyltransferase [Gelidibacter sp. F63206]